MASQDPYLRRAPRKTGGSMNQLTEETRPKPRVCRRLFPSEGSPDCSDGLDDAGLRDNMMNQITEQIGRHLDEACKKYNFDFRNEVPLEGDWSWERIIPENSSSPPGAEPPVTEGSHERPPQAPSTDLPPSVPQ